MNMLRVYVAGAYSADNVIDVLGNMRRGLSMSIAVLQAGHAPFSPWLDFQFGLIEDIPLNTYYAYSLAWLRVADCMLVVPHGADRSKGTQQEIQSAKELAIPVFFSLEEMLRYANSLEPR